MQGELFTFIFLYQALKLVTIVLAVDPIDILERKIAALELKVLPMEKQEENIKLNVTDMLLQINTLISAALSCREVVTAILNRMPELNRYLDPSFCEYQLTTESKRQFILAIYPEIKKYWESIQKLKLLVPILDSEPLQNVPTLVPKLEHLTLSTLKLHEEGQQVSKSITEALQQYNDIISLISQTLIQFEELVTQFELQMRPRVVIE